MSLTAFVISPWIYIAKVKWWISSWSNSTNIRIHIIACSGHDPGGKRSNARTADNAWQSVKLFWGPPAVPVLQLCNDILLPRRKLEYESHKLNRTLQVVQQMFLNIVKRCRWQMYWFQKPPHVFYNILTWEHLRTTESSHKRISVSHSFLHGPVIS